MKEKYVTPAKFVDFEKTVRNMHQRMIGKQFDQKMYGKFAEHRAIVWVLHANFEYIPASFVADVYEPEINTV